MAAISTGRGIRWLTMLWCAISLGVGAAERAAEVVSVQGQGESRADDKAAWTPAAPRQELFPSSFVRTGAFSRMGLLFLDRTQVRLAEKTILQIKAATPGGRTVLRLDQGRSWSQTNAAPANLYLETPSATAAIRGTDWDMEVFEGGRSLLTVFSGEVLFFNDRGSVTVAKNEQAQAIPGQAPVKILIANPRDRVQWVTAYSVDPLRHIDATGASPALREVLATIRRGEVPEATARLARAAMPDPPELLRLARIALLVRAERLEEAFGAVQDELASPRPSQPAAFLVASDLMVYQGRLDRASDYAQQGLALFKDDPRLVAQLARVSLAAGDFAEARQRIRPLLAGPRPPFEARLVGADTARADGEAKPARAGYESARGERPVDDRPWHGIGVVDSEREAVSSARRHLGAALERNPGGAGYRGELGTLETFADRFDQAQAAFTAALAANPSDYVALTGLGVLELKRGRPAAALENFLRASLLEPRYARAHVYAGVANYQMRRHEVALRELARASELDDKDPLPYLFTSMIQTDLFRAGEAIESARKALQRLPYLKSLNQVANDRQGGANLGRSLSFFGLEEWAQSRAQESYYPYWAGSHLFLSDRYPGQFNKNSELLQGFLADPTSFGSSNRFQSLVARPGTYGKALAGYAYAKDVNLRLPVARFNGLSHWGMPVAYLLDLDAPRFRFTGNVRGPDDGRAVTGAVGLRPRPELGLFLYGFDQRSDDHRTRSSLPFDLSGHHETRSLNLGAHYRLSPQSQIWARASAFRTQEDTAGSITFVDKDGVLVAETVDSRLVSRQPEYALRQTFDAGRHQLTWGGETADKDATNVFISGPGTDVQLVTTLGFDERSRAVFLSDAFEVTPRLLLQADVWWQRNRRTLDVDTHGILFGTEIVPFPSAFEDRGLDKVTPRFGFRYKLAQAAMVRAAYQDWIRSMGLSTLGPVATAGIPVDDRVVARGGRQERARAQVEIEASSRTFLAGFFDYRKIENRRFGYAPFLVSEDENLTKLRDFDYGRLGAGDLYEFISAPEFDGGVIKTAGGAVNQVVSDALSVSARYQYTDSRNTGSTFRDREIAFHPRNAASAGLTWVSRHRIFFTTRVAYRTRRYADEANRSPLPSGFDGSLDLFWESADKRVRLRFGLDNAFVRDKPILYSTTLVLNL